MYFHLRCTFIFSGELLTSFLVSLPFLSFFLGLPMMVVQPSSCWVAELESAEQIVWELVPSYFGYCPNGTVPLDDVTVAQ